MKIVSGDTARPHRMLRFICLFALATGCEPYCPYLGRFYLRNNTLYEVTATYSASWAFGDAGVFEVTAPPGQTVQLDGVDPHTYTTPTAALSHILVRSGANVLVDMAPVRNEEFLSIDDSDYGCPLHTDFVLVVGP